MIWVRRRRTWRIVFFAALFFFLLFWAWVLAAVASGQTPVSFLRSLAPDSGRSDDAPMVPISFYLENGYGVRSITPSDNRAASVNANGRRIVIVFTEDMDTGAADILTGWSVAGAELDFRRFSWSDSRTVSIVFDRDLGPEEYVSLWYVFWKADGEPMRPMVLTYK